MLRGECWQQSAAVRHEDLLLHLAGDVDSVGAVSGRQPGEEEGDLGAGGVVSQTNEGAAEGGLEVKRVLEEVLGVHWHRRVVFAR